LGFQLIQKTVSETFNQQGAVVYSTPFLLMGGTDSRHYKSITKNIYRFSPIDIHVAELPSIHGINESIRVQNYLDMVRFYHRFIGNLNQPFEPDAAISSAD
jgi:carboxypeptidase PM20D1